MVVGRKKHALKVARKEGLCDLVLPVWRLSIQLYKIGMPVTRMVKVEFTISSPREGCAMVQSLKSLGLKWKQDQRSLGSTLVLC